ncbi:hypothetical protein D9M69_545920 [compost metagenome]
MAARHVGHLRRMHEHAAHLGGLVGAAHPALDAGVGAPAGRETGHDGRQVARAEAHQRIVRIQGGDHDLADFPVGHGLAGAGADDFDNDVLAQHQPLAGGRFKGHHAEIGAAVCLVALDAARGEPVAQGRRERLAGHQRAAQRIQLHAQFVGLFQDDLEEAGRTRVAGGREVLDGAHLLLGLPGTAGEDGAAHGMRRGFHH